MGGELAESMQHSPRLTFSLSGVAALTLANGVLLSTAAQDVIKVTPSNNLTVVIIRHGEKPLNNHNLSCKGLNRALQLPEVLNKKFLNFDHTFVPSLKNGEHTRHARMFQTVTPLAIKNKLEVNSSFGGKDYDGIAKHLLSKAGTILLVWKHSKIQNIAQNLGVKNPPQWRKEDFDSIWVISFKNGKASLEIDKLGINPSIHCNY
ncbi:histidine phosphatase family protein [Synechococcus sp. UW179A]|uniref:histidine phosphatase family protein n=1 Tax=Synechococcus sp. UW179A TaxID=2575510 RepID=UPI000E0EBC3B|nr:histidine phosphatase family protein [Synechococcus sp. UW179A]